MSLSGLLRGERVTLVVFSGALRGPRACGILMFRRSRKGPPSPNRSPKREERESDKVRVRDLFIASGERESLIGDYGKKGGFRGPRCWCVRWLITLSIRRSARGLLCARARAWVCWKRIYVFGDFFILLACGKRYFLINSRFRKRSNSCIEKKVREFSAWCEKGFEEIIEMWWGLVHCNVMY